MTQKSGCLRNVYSPSGAGDTLVLLLPGEGDDNIPILSTVAKSIDEALGGQLPSSLSCQCLAHCSEVCRVLFFSGFDTCCVGAIGSYIKEESFEAKAGAAAMFPVFGKAFVRQNPSKRICV